MKLALYQPEIAQNVGTLLRLAACWNVAVDIIEPTGFLWDDKKLKRAGMDYLERASVTRHKTFEAFHKQKQGRLLLLDTKARDLYTDFSYKKTDIVMVGQESCGVPQAVYEMCVAQLRIPMMAGARSINVAIAAAIGLAEALRQNPEAILG
ncbi:tRNA (cytidine(34)-2'-O)-methyltransferase [Alphaproteobacteria bacterium]|nr:tRNA (cytidine(34)-2'-O)-methyltransferase [Alphaproteobacteria bacterium]GHS99107.1 tRNA (cytidine(34)-2'-O)-methyltransferase [Alphaproteobacteria bacterium]